ncbi:MAG: selenocysteine-specific translation elongation factor [Candidatus Brocadiales bacterium]|nr:selenocysteine-specific translation elongation factor [Candidatus Brocadiales bacterium]
MKNVVIGTAGHIDHGKTALVKALTGIDTDRLPEEKARGITIDLGFAFMDIEGGLRVGIVDVPGHERFVKNMLAGATGIDIALLVIAADDGVMPQTVEHLEILELLGLRHGLIVLSKKDLVSEEWLELVKEDIKRLMKGTFLEGAPVKVVSATTGEGIPELKAALRELVLAYQEEAILGIFRLPVDRAFTIQGFGCVVTGTVASGEIQVGQEVEVLPVKELARIRGIEVHGKKVDSASKGQRAAINLSGVKTSEICRGFQLSLPKYLEPVKIIDCHLHYLASARRPLVNGERVRFHIATSEVMARVTLLDKEVLRPGEKALVQYRLEEPIVTERAEHYVIRSYSPCRTIGGGKVLRVYTRRLKRLKEEVLAPLRLLLGGSDQEVIEQAFLEARGYLLSQEEVSRLLNIHPSRVKEMVESLIDKGALIKVKEDSNTLPVHHHRLSALKTQVLQHIQEFHENNPIRKGMEEGTLRARLSKDTPVSLLSLALQELIREGLVQHTSDQRVSAAGFQVKLSDSDRKTIESIQNAFLKERFSPPTLEQILPKDPCEQERFKSLLFLLIEEGNLIEVEAGMYFHVEAVQELKNRVKKTIQERGSITVADLRDLVSTSRKYAVPLLEYFDKIRFTRREGDRRMLYSH